MLCSHVCYIYNISMLYTKQEYVIYTVMDMLHVYINFSINDSPLHMTQQSPQRIQMYSLQVSHHRWYI